MSVERFNEIRLKLFDASGAEVIGALDHADPPTFDKFYPGGLYGSLTVFVPADVTEESLIVLNYRLVAMNGLKIVWEGYVTGLEATIEQDRYGWSVTALGFWGNYLMTRYIDKPWADKRTDQNIWKYRPESAYLKATESRQNNTLTITPKAQAWTNGEYARFRYVAPTGQTIKRVTCNYDFAEGAQAWECGLATSTFAPTDQVTATGTGSFDRTFATPQASCYLYWIARANQTPASDGSMRVIFSNIIVYTETGAINLTEIATDVVGYVTELSADTRLIASNTFSLVPFVANPKKYADVLMDAASYGDSSYNAWACGVRGSDLSSDGKPILFAEQQPALTDYDYALRLDEANVSMSARFVRDLTKVYNWVAVIYRNEQGHQVIITPDDDATLTDTTSVATYGRREAWITVDTESSTTATNYGRRYLAANKDPNPQASNDIEIVGYIRDKAGNPVPTSQIEPGKRLKVENYLNDISGTGLTIRITRTQYVDENEACRLSFGEPNSLDIYLARIGLERI